MKVVAPPPGIPGKTQGREDDLDALLRSFFKAELPDPWPSLEAPVPRPSSCLAQPPQRPSLGHSRLALAASIALLVLGSLFLLGKTQPPGTTPAGNVPAIGERDPLDHFPTHGPKRFPESGAGTIQSEGLKLMPDGNTLYEIKVGPAAPNK
jgi:hypothetical protein